MGNLSNSHTRVQLPTSRTTYTNGKPRPARSFRASSRSRSARTYHPYMKYEGLPSNDGASPFTIVSSQLLLGHSKPGVVTGHIWASKLSKSSTTFHTKSPGIVLGDGVAEPRNREWVTQRRGLGCPQHLKQDGKRPRKQYNRRFPDRGLGHCGLPADRPLPRLARMRSLRGLVRLACMDRTDPSSLSSPLTNTHLLKDTGVAKLTRLHASLPSQSNKSISSTSLSHLCRAPRRGQPSWSDLPARSATWSPTSRA